MTEQERRELNRRIAVEVMGLRVYEVTPEQYSMYIQKERDYVYEGELYYLTGCQAHRVPDYLTGDGMLAVLERMKPCPLIWRDDNPQSPYFGWNVRLRAEDGDLLDHFHGPELPEQVALAALRQTELQKGVQ